MLVEDNQRVKIGEPYYHCKVQQLVKAAIDTQVKNKPVGDITNNIIRFVVSHEESRHRSRKNNDTAGENQRYHTRRVDAQRDEGALTAINFRALRPVREAHRDFALAFLDQDDTDNSQQQYQGNDYN